MKKCASKTLTDLAYGIIVGAGLFLTGVLLQLALGPVDWSVFAWPVNLVSITVYAALLLICHLLRGRCYVLRFMSSVPASVTSMAAASVLTVVMGLVRQEPSSAPYAGFPGFGQMVTNWAFVLLYFWMLSCLGMTVLRVCIPFSFRKLPFTLNHLGLFVALLCGVMGAADLQRLQMTAVKGGAPEWRATDARGHLYELPIALELKDFTIDEYPPKLLFASNLDGSQVPGDGWSLETVTMLESAAPVFSDSSLQYVPFYSEGACSAALVRATSSDGTVLEDWVSCGSHIFPIKALTLSDEISVVMPPREPRSYVSAVDIYTQSGKSFSDTIKVNSPCRVDGWKIYQLSYDSNKGKWSSYSVFEIVRDPWLVPVYIGIWMLIAGAVCMFVQFGRKKEDLR